MSASCWCFLFSLICVLGSKVVGIVDVWCRHAGSSPVTCFLSVALKLWVIRVFGPLYSLCEFYYSCEESVLVVGCYDIWFGCLYTDILGYTLFLPSCTLTTKTDGPPLYVCQATRCNIPDGISHLHCLITLSTYILFRSLSPTA